MGSIILLNIIAGVALLVWGLGLVRRGIERGYGDKLDHYLSKSTNNRVKSFFAGIGITALIQSSTATTLLVSSFAGGRYITLVAALAVMLGANVGRTIIAQILAFDLSWVAPVFLIVGVVSMKVLAKRFGSFKNLGRIFLGLSFIFLALDMMVSSAAPLKESDALIGLFTSLGDDPVLTVLLGVLLTWVFHSSLAFVLLTMSLVAAGVVPFAVGVGLVIGANVGSSIPPVLVTANDNVLTRQVTIGNLLMRLVWAAYLTPLAPWIASQLSQFSDLGAGRMLINFHMGFNILMAITFLPWTGYFSDWLQKLFKDDDKPEKNPGHPRYLDENLIETPSAALSAAMRESLRLSDKVGQMLKDIMKAIKSENSALVDSIRQQDNAVDDLFKAIKIYLIKVSREELSVSESIRFAQILSFATNMEHIGDIIVRNLTQVVGKKQKAGVRFSEEGFAEIKNLHKAISRNFHQAESILMTGDRKMAEKLLATKKDIRQAEIESSQNHLNRLKAGKEDTIATTNMHVDIMRDLKRISSHIMAMVYPFVHDSEGQKNDWLNAYHEILGGDTTKEKKK